MPTKKCNKCKEILPLSHFGKLSSASDGLRYRCRQCIKVDKAEFRKKNPDRVKGYLATWIKGNPEKAAAGNKRRALTWNENNRPKIKEKTKKWANENRGLRSFYGAQRRQASRTQTIAMSEDQIAEIKSIYDRARLVSEKTGIPHHVDHIIPLKAKNCSGLNVPWNLQIITAQENMRKRNSMPCESEHIALSLVNF
jgi:hypothetical protein